MHQQHDHNTASIDLRNLRCSGAQVCDKAFRPPGTVRLLPHEDLTEPGRPYPHMASPLDLADELLQRAAALDQSARITGAAACWRCMHARCDCLPALQTNTALRSSLV